MKIFVGPSASSVQYLLAENNLPANDVDDLDLSCFLACGPTSSPTGIIGLEVYQQNALLRSLVVAADSRNSGCGQALVAAIEQFARNRGVSQLYLLTETAERFFQNHGYEPVDRKDLPETIRQTAQFRDLCPQSACAMTKHLGNTG